MPTRPQWLLAIPDAIHQLEELDRELLVRRDIERGWLRLHEKGGKRHDVPAHHRAAAAVDAYVVAGGIADAKAPLFQSIDRSRRASLFVRAVAAEAPSGQQSKIRTDSG